MPPYHGGRGGEFVCVVLGIRPSRSVFLCQMSSGHTRRNRGLL